MTKGLLSALVLLSVATVASAQRERVEVDLPELYQRLTPASGKAAARSSATVTLPWFGDGSRAFEAHEANQFAPELRARYPDIRSYRLTAPGRREVVGRLNVSPEGAFAVLLDGEAPVELRHEREGGRIVQYLERVDASREAGAFGCGVSEGAPVGKTGSTAARTQASGCFRVGGALRRYRMALTNTGEFAERTTAGTPTNASVNAAFNDRLAELNAIYEREAAVTFELVGGNDVNIHLSAGSDPFDDPDEASNDGANLSATRAVIEANLSSGDYDIGHGLHAVVPVNGMISASGLAGVGVVCTSSKAAGWSRVYAEGSLVILQHEVGHQFSCQHTNYGCNGVNAQRFEPGQGVTIMATATADCSASSDVFGARDWTRFHVGSARAIEAHIGTTATCYTTESRGNDAPTADANPTGATYVIPANTAFALEGTGADADGDALTYSWEQVDTDETTEEDLGASATSTTAPLFRSFAPVSTPRRYFPELSLLLAGDSPDGSNGEILPAVSRTLTFALTVRDNVTGAACDQVAVQVVNTGATFAITSQNSPRTWDADGANTATVTWDVAGTTGSGIDAPEVDILLSTDGGQTFPFPLATATANDGSHTFTVPDVPTTSGRILVRGTGKVFFDVNDADLTIRSTSGCDAVAATLSPSESVTAPAGAAELDLGLSPIFGTPAPTTIDYAIDGGDPRGTLVGEDTPSGDCVDYDFGDVRYEVRSITVDASGDYAFTSSENNIPLTLFTGDYDPNAPCSGYLGSTFSSELLASGSVSYSTQSFTADLTVGEAYSLVAFGLNVTGTVQGSYSGPGQVVEVEAAPSSYGVTYAILADATGEIEAFDPSADLSDASAYGAGDYTVLGVSVEDGADLSAYVGQTEADLRAATGSAGLCARVSSNAVAVSIQGSLPVELTGLDAVAEPGGNRVSWTTATEVGASHFVVERREGDRYLAIGEVVAAAPRGGAYDYLDADAPDGASYYRLRSVDLDGTTEVSAVVTVTRAAPAGGYALFPNPATGTEVQLRIGGPATEREVDLELRDAVGRLLSLERRSVSAGTHVRVAAPRTAGVYTVTIRDDRHGEAPVTLRGVRLD